MGCMHGVHANLAQASASPFMSSSFLDSQAWKGVVALGAKHRMESNHLGALVMLHQANLKGVQLLPAPSLYLVGGGRMTGCPPCMHSNRQETPPRLPGSLRHPLSAAPAAWAQVVHVAVEMAPIAKVGGMGDVVTALGRAVQEEGHTVEVRVGAWGAQWKWVKHKAHCEGKQGGLSM